MDRDSIEIRELTSVDHRPVGEIADSLSEWFTARAREKIPVDLRFQPGLVAVLSGEVVGFVTFFVSEAVGHIGWLGVLPQHHRKGIGRMLVDRTIERLTQAGVEQLRVDTLSDAVDYEPYERTRRFYRALGFRELYRRKQDNPECPELLVLEREL